ncbi:MULTISPECIES: pyocin knob domain-containing protein [Pseudomonas]|nr:MULTISPECIES: pyocin knob domain-containing protein [Pseudomonas]
MARQDINLGTAPTGVGGDTTRSTGVKINAMMTELYARQALLGTASNAALTVGTNDTTVGRAVKVGDYGLGTITVYTGAGLNDLTAFGYYYINGGFGTPAGYANGWLFTLPINTNYVIQDYRTEADGASFTRAKIAGTWQPWRMAYNTSNTSRASDGTLKAI